VLRDRALVGKRYAEVFGSLECGTMTTLHRDHGHGFFVDDSPYAARVVGDLMGMPGGNREVSFRLLHVCEFRDGKISRENVRLDGGAIMAQLSGAGGPVPTSPAPAS
jgi:hypothetical protein